MIPRSSCLIFTSMLLTAIILANLLIFLSTDASVSNGDNNKNKLVITDTSEHLIWFLQISDIHISIFRDPERITEFKEFSHYTIDAIKPSVVLASGDLTDAKTPEGIGSKQYMEEWQYYRNILKENNVPEKTLWLDIRGNHDNFNVASPDSLQNFFHNYSIQGKAHPRSYMYQIDKGGERYSFIGIDACLEPGPRRPFNFIGMLDELEVDELNKLIDKAESTNNNYTIWFGHFPTSCILTPGKESVRDIIGKHKDGLVYVCGHLHKLGGLVPRMYTLQKSGFLELEVGDWKDNRVFRLLAVDHGLLSFIDVTHRQWPIGLITNPKDALVVNPYKGEVEKLKISTHIRILAFSISKITSVKVRIDQSEWTVCRNKKGPLYVAPWNSEEYKHGLHEIEVHIEDLDGRVFNQVQQFSLDGTKLQFPLLARIALMTDASTMFQITFAIMLIASVLPLAVMRVLHKLASEGKISRPRLRRSCLKLWIRKLWVLSTVDRIFWPLILYPIYLSFGPWSVGYLVEDRLGVIFVWGLFVNNSYLPGSFTYAYGCIQLFTFQIPLTLILAHGIDHRFQYKILKPGLKKTWSAKLCLHLPFLIVFGIQVQMAYLFWLAYGTMAFVLGPLRTWSIILAAILWYLALSLPEKCTRRAASIWASNQNKNNQPSQSSPDK